ncbi:hypothetical protein [Streptomyces sp. NPDC127084]|uniref:hypothetical protein n=1 Tax=Streptomyces sp. NPDC127084 TaxID=3347133 RepID=UPI003655B4F0
MRPAQYTAPTAFLLVLAFLAASLSALMPTGTAWASGKGVATAGAATDDECAALPLAPFGDPGSAMGEATIAESGSACFTFSAEAAGLHRVLVASPDGTGGELYEQVHENADGTGDPLSCYDTDRGSGWCELPRVGTYTLKVVNRGWDSARAQVAVIPLATTAGCLPEKGTSWDGAAYTGSSPSPLAVQCHPFAGRPGERIVVEAETVHYGELRSWITDETGAHICPRFNEDRTEGCVLPGDGPYRVLTWVQKADRGFPADYRLTIRRLNDPEGCTRVSLNAFDSAPTKADPPSGCKTFTAPAAGRYSVYEVDSELRERVRVHDSAGKAVCEGGDDCELPAAGDYTVFTDHQTLIVDWKSTEGCVPGRLGTYQGTFGAAGEIDCLILPLPTGARIAALTTVSGQGPDLDPNVVDANGTAVCSGTEQSSGACVLKGEAPYRVVITPDHGDEPVSGAYILALHRMDGSETGCTNLPAGDFTDRTAAALLKTGDGVFSHCLSIPADDHSATENIQLVAESGSSVAKYTVLDAMGEEVCSVRAALSTWSTCGLAPGVAHTVLFNGNDIPASYTLTRRDVTGTAKGCAVGKASAVGGPSTGGSLRAPGGLVCHRITTGSAKDTLHLNVRDALGSANILPFDANGNALCGYVNKACSVTGSTSYQVLLGVRPGDKAASSYRLDALRIGTAAGPAPECVKVPSVTYGFGPFTGTLDEQHSAMCAVLPTAWNDRFDVRVTDTKGAKDTAVPAMYGGSKPNNRCYAYAGADGSGHECYLSESYTKDVIPSVFVLGLPEKTSGTSYKAEITCTGGFCGTEEVSVGSVAPTTGTTGSKVAVTVTGTALHKDHTVKICSNGRCIEATTTAVAPDRRTLTAVLDLKGAAAGTWSISVHARGWQYSRGYFTVTEAPVKNTAAPKINGTARVGARLTATSGSWTPAGSSSSYQWKADGKAIAGATGSAYTVPASLLGKKLSVTVTARHSEHPKGVATSAAVTVAKGSAPKASKLPVITGTAKVGRTLKASHGTWSPAPASYTYQWYANGTAITGATRSSLVLKTAQRGKKITVRVKAVRTGHSSGYAVSKSTGAVAR